MINFERRRGTQVPTAKMTEAKVRAIRKLAAQGKTLASLGRKYGIGEQQVGRIVHRKSWRHVE